jgi:hypothetical protein
MCGDVYVTGYVSSDVDRSVLNKVLMVLVHLKHWLPQVWRKEFWGLCSTWFCIIIFKLCGVWGTDSCLPWGTWERNLSIKLQNTLDTKNPSGGQWQSELMQLTSWMNMNFRTCGTFLEPLKLLRNGNRSLINTPYYIYLLQFKLGAGPLLRCGHCVPRHLSQFLVNLLTLLACTSKGGNHSLPCHRRHHWWQFCRAVLHSL